MDPGAVAVIIVEPVPIAAGQDLGRIGEQHAGPLEIGIAREVRRIALAEKDEDQAGIVARRIARDPHPLAEGPVLVRLLDALAGRIVAPAMIAAAQTVALDPA